MIDASDASFILQKYAELSTTKPITFKSECISSKVKANSKTAVTINNESVYAQTNFALSLLKNQSLKNNVCISPLSIAQAISMTANGASGNTRNEIENAIGMDIENLNDFFHSYNNALSNNVEFRSVNSLWIKNTDMIDIEKDFLQYNADYYNADIFSTAFDKTTLNDLNNWVAYQTNNQILKIVDDISDTALMYLVNVTSFDGEWECKFSDSRVGVYDFNSFDGSKTKMEMMNSFESYYLCDSNATGIYKYYNGRRFAFAAILPKDDVTLDEYILNLTAEQLNGILSNPQSCVVNTRLPKFKYEYDSVLNDSLSIMGMKTAFNEDADFTKIGKTANSNLFISSIQHKIYIDVNQEGTKASSATSIEMGSTAYPIEPQKMKNIIFDRPFLFCIIDTEMNMPIFIGTFVGS